MTTLPLHFARVCVEVDLKLPLLNGIQIDDGPFRQRVKYENLPRVCYTCNLLGHSTNQCPQTKFLVKLS